MKILYIHQYFNIPAQPGGTRSYEFAKYLISKGHQVTMITSGVMNSEFPVPADKDFVEREFEGIGVVSINAGYHDARTGTGMPGWKRMLSFLGFAKLATRVGKKLGHPDVVFATHTPLTVGLTGMKLGRFFSVPFVFEVRDLWPDALVNIGAISNPLVIWYLRRMERKIYAAADHISAASPGMKAGVCRQGIDENRVTVIPNSSDLQLFHPDLDGLDHRERLGIGDRFAAIYFGAMGLANGLDYTLDAARILKERGSDKIVIVLHGSGGKKQELQQRAEAEGLDNVIFSDPVPRKADLAHIVAACDTCMTIYKATKEVTWSPNKMFDALAAGKPVIVNVGQWLGDTVENNNCGRHVHSDRPEELADALEHFASHPETCKQMSKNSRALAEKEFAREILAKRLEDIFIDVTIANRQHNGKTSHKNVR